MVPQRAVSPAELPLPSACRFGIPCTHFNAHISRRAVPPGTCPLLEAQIASFTPCSRHASFTAATIAWTSLFSGGILKSWSRSLSALYCQSCTKHARRRGKYSQRTFVRWVYLRFDSGPQQKKSSFAGLSGRRRFSAVS